MSRCKIVLSHPALTDRNPRSFLQQVGRIWFAIMCGLFLLCTHSHAHHGPFPKTRFGCTLSTFLLSCSIPAVQAHLCSWNKTWSVTPVTPIHHCRFGHSSPLRDLAYALRVYAGQESSCSVHSVTLVTKKRNRMIITVTMVKIMVKQNELKI